MDNNETLKYEASKHFVFDAPKSEILRVSCSRVQLEILGLLYKQSRRCASYVKKEFLIEKLNEKIDAKDLKFHVDCLNEKECVIIKQVYDGFITTEKIGITEKGIHLLVENSALNL